MRATPTKTRQQPCQARRAAGPRLHAVALALAALGAVPLAHGQQAPTTLPTAGTVARGAATITQNGAVMNIAQTSQRAVINWGTFNVGSQARVDHALSAGRAGLTVHRVTGANGASLIDGAINSNGRVFLINTAGVVFGSTAQVNVGALVASSRDLDPNFTADNFAAFADGNPLGEIAFNQGSAQVFEDGTGDVVRVQTGARLVAAPDGSIVLIGGRRVDVERDAALLATQGTGRSNVSVVSAPTTTVDITDSGFVRLAGTSTATHELSTTVAVSGTISAANGTVELRADANDDAQVSLNTAQVRAIGSGGGEGDVQIVANGSSSRVDIDGGVVDVSASGAAQAGTVRIIADNIRIGGRRNDSIPGGEGHESGFGATIRADGSGATNGGNILIGDEPGEEGSGRVRSIVIEGSLSEVLGRGDGAFISASATGTGDGGNIQIVSTRDEFPGEGEPQPRQDFGVIEMAGTLRARSAIGLGGKILTSAPAMTFGGESRGLADVNASGPGGAGEWLIEAFDVQIANFRLTDSDSGFEPTRGLTEIHAGNDVRDTLANGTSVSVRARAVNEFNGDLLVLAGTTITNENAAAPTTLSLQADNDVRLEGSVTIASTNSQSGAPTPLNVQLLGDRDDSGRGRVILAGSTGSSSQSSPVTISTQGGSVLIAGGFGDTGFAQGYNGDPAVSISATSISTLGDGTAGNIAIRGQGNVVFFDESGAVGAEGVSIFGSTLDGKNIELTGFGTAGRGLTVAETRITAAGGTIDMRGVLDDQLESGFGTGVLIGSSAFVLNDGGRASVAGRADGIVGEGGGQAFVGVLFDGVTFTTAETQARSRVTIAGEAGVPGGVGVSQGGQGNLVQVFGNTDLVLGGSAGTGGIAVDIPRISVSIDGQANLRPLGVDESGGIVEAFDTRILVGDTGERQFDGFVAPSVWFTGGSENFAIGAADVVIGSQQHRGQIEVTDGTFGSYFAPVTLQNQGADSEGILLLGNIGNAEVPLTLRSDGNILQDGNITTSHLSVQGTFSNRSIFLNSSGNRIGALTFDGGTEVVVSSQGDIRIEGGTLQGFDTGLADGGDFTAEAIGVNRAGSTLEVHSLDGDVVLNQSIAMLGGGEGGIEVDLISAGNFQNIGNGTITLEGTGQWRIWSTRAPDTLAGAALRGSAGTRSLYGCAFGGEGCASGVQIPETGNLFLFAEQPTLQIAAVDRVIQQGAALPPLDADVAGTVAATGLLNGDTAADALAGVLTTDAVSAVPGSYAIGQGTVVSDTGYLITSFTAGSLTVLPNDFKLPNQYFLTKGFMDEQSSEVYGRNTNRPQICAAVSTIRGITEGDAQLDPLTVEWTRVRAQPHLSSCLAVRNDNACSSF